MATGLATAAALCIGGRFVIAPLGNAAARARAVNLFVALDSESPREAMVSPLAGLAMAASAAARGGDARAVVASLARAGNRRGSAGS